MDHTVYIEDPQDLAASTARVCDVLGIETEDAGWADRAVAAIERLREDVAMYEQWAAASPRYDAECPCGRRVSVRTVATEDVKRWQAIEQRARAKADAPRRLDGAASWDVARHILGEA